VTGDTVVKKLTEWVKRNWRTAVVVFQAFWILIVIVDALQNQDTARIPEFIYVNF
jgi:hypothetical protein